MPLQRLFLLSFTLLVLCLGQGCFGGAVPPVADPAAGRRTAEPPSRQVGAALPGVVSHTVRPGETLWRISHLYGADLEELIAVNGLDDSALIHSGQVLLVPAPTRLPSANRTRLSLRWPLRGEIRSRFGRRGRQHHDGIDINGRHGNPIRAAADGEVVVARSWGAYGKTVVLDHGTGVRTLYAHASKLLVKVGQRVRAGQTIARVGSSGNATGSHLHFEVQKSRRPVDPLLYLPLEQARAGSPR
ncbi:MAG: LysM peptidoglycan-binding domain-containing M23 family metallopeptidase [Acidobacteriota bacterium]